MKVHNLSFAVGQILYNFFDFIHSIRLCHCELQNTGLWSSAATKGHLSIVCDFVFLELSLKSCIKVKFRNFFLAVTLSIFIAKKKELLTV